MSGEDSGDNFIRPTGLTDSTIITINGSSTENATPSTDTQESFDPNADEEMTEESTQDNPPTDSTGDVEAAELAAFENGMRKLRVSPKKDSNVTNIQDVSGTSVNDKSQLFETCSMISTQQHKKYPAKPPKTCLMDQVSVS